MSRGIIPLEDPNEVNADPAMPERVVGRRIVYSAKWYAHWSGHGGTYGMGGPGFFALHLEETVAYPAEWLMLCLWSATNWLTVNGVWLAAHLAQHSQQRPLHSYYGGTDTWDDFGPMVENKAITKFDVQQDHCHLVVDHSVHIRFDKDPSKRPVWQGTGKPRILGADEHLRDAWRLCNTLPVMIG